MSDGWVPGEEMIDTADRSEDESGGQDRGGGGRGGMLCLTLSLMMEEGQSHSTVERLMMQIRPDTQSDATREAQ